MNQKFIQFERHPGVLLIGWVALALLFQTISFVPLLFAAENTVIIFRSQQIAAYNEAIQGFEEGCEGKNIKIKTIYDLHGDTEEAKRIIQMVKETTPKPNAILTVGVLAATLVKEHFPGIPIIFCMVINHDRFNLQGTNITGISSEASIEDQFAVLQEILGPHKNIGVIYDPSKTRKMVAQANVVAKQFDFNLVKTEVIQEKEVESALKNITNKIDALWVIPDSTVITQNTLKTIPRIIREHRLPIFSTSDAIVKAGALIAVSPNYRYTGIQAAQLAQMLLTNPETSSLGVQQPGRLKLTLNTQTAKAIGINLSSIQSYPDVVLYPQ
ncbi:MAG: hypothetical protein B6D35_11810 [Candidatus Brocadia sp. UTAMX2]|jgi:putative ABC transport system substrate-binding protein|nr:MAG: hypothetical protein B6D35_11810 [Candidatus Brocadia sp. UTAMX2]